MMNWDIFNLFNRNLVLLGAATIRSPWPYFSSKLESFGLTIPQEQYALYGTTLFAIGASRKPFMQAYWMNKYLRETDESVKMIYAFRGKFSHVELNGGEAYLKELRRVPHRWALLPLSFIIVEGTRIAYKRLFSSKFNDH